MKPPNESSNVTSFELTRQDEAMLGALGLTNERPIEDNGFTDRVMLALPPSKNRNWIRNAPIPIALLLGCVVAAKSSAHMQWELFSNASASWGFSATAACLLVAALGWVAWSDA